MNMKTLFRTIRWVLSQ